MWCTINLDTKWFMYSNDNQQWVTRSKQKQKHLLPSRAASLVTKMMCKPLSAIQEVLIGYAYVQQPDAEAPNTK